LINYFKSYSSLGDDRFLCHPVVAQLPVYENAFPSQNSKGLDIFLFSLNTCYIVHFRRNSGQSAAHALKRPHSPSGLAPQMYSRTNLSMHSSPQHKHDTGYSGKAVQLIVMVSSSSHN